MKQALLFLTAFLFVTATQATVRTVSNVPANLAQFNTIQAAVDASANGDTVYVHGSPNQYAFFQIADKKVVVIGPGWSPDKNLPLQAVVQGCYLYNNIAAGDVAGSELNGLIFTSTVELATSTSGLGTSNIRVIRCQFNTSLNITYSSTGFLFEGNVFLSTISFNCGSTFSNILFQNNVFHGNQGYISYSVVGLTNCVNVRFDHNLFYGDGTTGGAPVFGNNCRFMTLTNNIFNERNPASGVSFTTYNNNITYNCSADGGTAWIRNNNVDAGGNIAAQRPQMADQAAVDLGTQNPLLNFTIAAGPANNSGTDGKDLGLLYDASGALNWTNSRNSRLPRLFSMNIINPTIAPGGTLNVSVNARKSN